MDAYIAILVISLLLGLLITTWAIAPRDSNLQSSPRKTTKPLVGGTIMATSPIMGPDTTVFQYTPGNFFIAATISPPNPYVTPWAGRFAEGGNYITDANGPGTLITAYGAPVPFNGTLGPLKVHFLGRYTAIGSVGSSFNVEVWVSKYPGASNFKSSGLIVPITNVPRAPQPAAVYDLTSTSGVLPVNQFDRYIVIIYNNIKGLVSIDFSISLTYQYMA